jgi:hypothetical protein
MARPVLAKLPPNAVNYAFDGALAVQLGDLMFHDANDVKPAASLADEGSELANQIRFAQLFAGISKFGALATELDARNEPVMPDGVVEIDCASSTFEVGDLLAIDEAASGTALENAKLVKTTNPFAAIGRCVKREADAATRVVAELLGRTTQRPVVPKIECVVDHFLFSAMTDSGGATGTINLARQIPAGSLVLGYGGTVHTGFTGDTTATLLVGVSGDANAFSFDATQSVLAAGNVGSNAVVDANNYRNAATTVLVTVTGGADFTSVAAGSLTLWVIYIPING